MQHNIENHTITMDAGLVQNLNIAPIPHTITGDMITVFDDMRTCRHFAAQGLYLPGPITWDYHWPTSFPAPFAHQIATSNFLTFHRNAFVFNELGTGKTLSVLWAADYLRRRGDVHKVLIVGTLSTLHNVWESDVFKHLPRRTTAILHSSFGRDTRLRELRRNVDFYIINHDGLVVIQDELIARKDIDLVVVDEGAAYRNAQTDKWKVLKKVLGNKPVWWMTGAPMPNAPTDIWAQARLVNAKLVPKYFSRFRDQIMFKVGEYNWYPRQGWQNVVYNAIRPAVRFKRDECFDLPDCTYDYRYCEMSPDQEKAYQALKTLYMHQMDDGLITAVNEGVKLMKLLQIATGAVYDTEGGAHEFNCKPKLNLLDEAIEESGRKIIVATPFKHSINLLYKHISKTCSVKIVNGDVSASKRSIIFREFQDGDLEVLLVHPQVMAHGLNLTSSHVILWWGPMDSFDIYGQANGRITRPGQFHKQIIRHLICSDVEKRVYQRLGRKENLQGILLELLKT